MSKNVLARLSGLFYLIIIITGVFSLLYVPSALIVGNDGAATTANILASEFLFRAGIVSQLVMDVFFILLPLALYQLLKSVDKNYALLMVIFAVVSVPIDFVNVINKTNILSLLHRAEYLQVFSTVQLHEQVMVLLDAFNRGIDIVQVFWGLWLFPFGYLVFKSEFLPKLLGVLLMLGCVGNLIEFLAKILFSIHELPAFVSIPGALGEFGICFWLLVMGVRPKQNG